jgi:tetratricopeptide (TPR) repeat protein
MRDILLRMRIEGKIYGAAAVSKIAREGADVVPAESGLVSIYAVAAEILSQHGHFDESFELLNRGIREISSHQNVFSLYQLAAQISTQIGQSEEALQILRSGIDRVSADHGKFSLYQAIGNILNRNNESAQAIDWLLRGRTELTDAQAGHRLATAAVQIAYAEDCLERLRDAELGEQHDLLAIMTALLQEDFYRAATLGKKAIDRSPRALQCYGPTAFAFLCLGEPAKAKEITSRLPRESRHQIGAVRHWFAAFIALELELIDEVKSNVVAYLGRPLGAHEIVDRALLLKLWDSSPEMWGENVAFYFPRLPPGLTGLKETIVRHQYGGTALIEIEAPAPFAQTEAGRSFDSALVVSTMRPDEWFGLYVLGCYDRLKTVYAQQCRALSLIHALCKIDEVREGRRVGVIGGGAAGITAAAAAATKGAKVIVWELAEHLMPLQRQNTNRYLHPHIYHWPNISSDSKRADLPLLDWVADMSNGVAEQLRQRFDRVRGETGGAIEVRLGQIISNILVVGDRISPSGFRVLGDNGNIDEQVDVVIVAIGFGIEKRQRLGIETPPYWKDDGLDQTLDASPMKPRRILISGSGDGALIDILRVKLKDFRHDEILDLLPKDRAMSHLERELQRIEERAENARVNPRLPPVSLNREYSRLALPDSLKVELSGRIRRDTKVCFNFSSPDRYALSSSLLNRFLVSTLCSLNEVAPKWAELTEQTISRVSGGLYLVNWANSTEPESFDDVVIRHGPPADHLESVFPFIAKQCAPLRGKLRDLALTGWLDNATKQFFTR